MQGFIFEKSLKNSLQNERFQNRKNNRRKYANYNESCKLISISILYYVNLFYFIKAILSGCIQRPLTGYKIVKYNALRDETHSKRTSMKVRNAGSGGQIEFGLCFCPCFPLPIKGKPGRLFLEKK
jgi:hypothetical protein